MTMRHPVRERAPRSNRESGVRATKAAETVSYEQALERPLVGDARWERLLGTLAFATAPIWAPIQLASVRNQRQQIYQQEYVECMAGELAEAEAAGYWP